MRRRFAATLVVVALALAAALPAAAAPRSEGFDFVRLMELALDWYWSVPLAAGAGLDPSGGSVPPESVSMAEGHCGDPSGLTAPPGPSCLLLPRAQFVEPDPDR